MAVRVNGGVREQSFVAWSGILIVELARGRRAVDPDVRVMHDLLIAGTEFRSPDVAPRFDRQGEHENARHISPSRGDTVRVRPLHDDDRSAALPSFSALGS